MVSALARLWKDTADVYRYTEHTEGSITKTRNELVVSSVKCHYSKSNLTDAGDNGVPTLVNSYTLFCSLDANIKEGDEVIVTQRNGRQITLAIGEGFPYSSHQEFRVKRSDKA